MKAKPDGVNLLSQGYDRIYNARFICNIYIYIHIICTQNNVQYMSMHVIYTLVSYFSLYKMFEHYKRVQYVYY